MRGQAPVWGHPVHQSHSRWRTKGGEGA